MFQFRCILQILLTLELDSTQALFQFLVYFNLTSRLKNYLSKEEFPLKMQNISSTFVGKKCFVSNNSPRLNRK